jgi:hypothetical protein
VLMSAVVGKLLKLKWGSPVEKDRYQRCPLYQPNRVYPVALGRGYPAWRLTRAYAQFRGYHRRAGAR